MRKLILITVSLLMSIGLFAQNQNDKILGKWENKEKTHIIEFVKNGNTYEAIIRKSKNSSVIGKKQITGLRPSTKGIYVDGELFLYQKKTSVECSVKLVNDTKIEIKASKGWMSKTEVWTKL